MSKRVYRRKARKGDIPDVIEAIITVGGVTLTTSQSMTVRVAICSFVADLMEKGLGDDEHGKLMTKAYLENCRTIEKMIDESIQAQ